MPAEARASQSASVPLAHPMAWEAAQAAAAAFSKCGDLGAEDEALRVADLGDGVENLLAQREKLAGEIEHGNCLRHRCGPWSHGTTHRA